MVHHVYRTCHASIFTKSYYFFALQDNIYTQSSQSFNIHTSLSQLNIQNSFDTMKVLNNPNIHGVVNVSNDTCIDHDNCSFTTYDDAHFPSVCQATINEFQSDIRPGIKVKLTRTIDAKSGLCKGTILHVNKIGFHVVEAKIVSGLNAGHITFIPRLPCIADHNRMPLHDCTRQFPLVVCFQMMKNNVYDKER